MIGLFNRFLTTWVARAFFLVLLAALVTWGVGDMLRNVGQGGSVATVDGKALDENEFAHDMRRAMAQRTHLTSNDISADLKRDTANQVLQDMIARASVDAQARRMNLGAPESALRKAIYAMPGFQNNGQFDPAQYRAVLQEHGLTEVKFLELLKSQLYQQQLLGAMRAGVGASNIEAGAIFDFQAEKRLAYVVKFPFAGAKQPPAPTEAQLRRYYANHPDQYISPEYRHVKAVLLTAEGLARGIDVPDSALHEAYQRMSSQYQSPEKRTVQLIVTDKEATARRLAAAWNAGADWTEMQKEADAAGATATVSDQIGQAQIPSPALAKAVFAATANQTVGPVQDSLGWDVARVTKISPPVSKSFADVRDELHGKLAQAKATDLLYQRFNKVQDILASGSKLEELPPDLGLMAVAGMLDKQGLTQAGEPAPIPAQPAVRAALIGAAFAAHIGDAPQLSEVRGTAGSPSAYYTIEVDQIMPAGQLAFDKAEASVRDDWLKDARRHEQDIQATALMLAARGAKNSLSAASQVAKLPGGMTPPVSRSENGPRAKPQPGIPPVLARVLFGIKPQEITMVETDDGFAVIQLTQIIKPDRKADPIGFGTIHDKLAELIGDDVERTYEMVLMTRASPQINRQRLDSLIQIAP